MKTRLTVRCVAYIAVLLSAACAATAPKVRIDKAADTDFAQYQSFNWLVPADKPGETLRDQRVQAAIAEVLRAKGYAQDTQHPDMEVTYTLNTYDRPKSSGMSVGIGAGGGSGHVGGGVGISLPIGKRSERAGTMTIDIFDANRKAQLWTGALDTTFSKADLTVEDARRAVSEILKQFPERGR